jgi:hypothetical protein
MEDVPGKKGMREPGNQQRKCMDLYRRIELCRQTGKKAGFSRNRRIYRQPTRISPVSRPKRIYYVVHKY